MGPRLIDDKHCPHCKAELPDPKPRVCPECAGSLQKRYLASGCLSSRPALVLLAAGAAFFAARAEPDPAQETAPTTVEPAATPPVQAHE